MWLWFNVALLKNYHFFLMLGVLVSSCGYTLNHRLKKTFKGTNQGIFISVFDNASDEVGAEMFFTNALIRELESHGEKTVPVRENAGLEIKGKVLRISHEVENSSGGGTKGTRALSHEGARLYDYASIPNQIGVRVLLLLEVLDPQTHQLKWTKEFSGFRRVSAPLDRVSDRDAPSSLPLITQSLIENSYPDIARDVMREVYDEMIDVY